MRRLAVITSHPIPYQAPIWRSLASDPEIELCVFFEKKVGLPDGFDSEFGKKVDWGLPLLEGYEYSFVRGHVHLWKELRKGRFDGLLLHSWNSSMPWLGAVLARLFDIRTLLRSENPLKHEQFLPAWKKAVKRIFLGIFFSLIDAFLYVGKGNRDFYEHYGVRNKRMIFAPYGVENKRFFQEKENMPDKKAVRRKLGLPEDAVQYLSVGKLIPKKNPMDILRAYEKLALPHSSLVFVGDGELLSVLRRYAEDKVLANVLFPGFKSQAEISEYYASSDVFVLASGRGETWGLVVNEAMCFGLPVLVSDMVGSAEDLVKDVGTGAVFVSGDIVELSQAMKEFASPEKRALARQNALQIIQDYSPEKTVQAIKRSLS